PAQQSQGNRIAGEPLARQQEHGEHGDAHQPLGLHGAEQVQAEAQQDAAQHGARYAARHVLHQFLETAGQAAQRGQQRGEQEYADGLRHGQADQPGGQQGGAGRGPGRQDGDLVAQRQAAGQKAQAYADGPHPGAQLLGAGAGGLGGLEHDGGRAGVADQHGDQAGGHVGDLEPAQQAVQGGQAGGGGGGHGGVDLNGGCAGATASGSDTGWGFR